MTVVMKRSLHMREVKFGLLEALEGMGKTPEELAAIWQRIPLRGPAWTPRA